MTNYLEKTLADIQRILAEDSCRSHLILQQGLLQQLEARVKIIGFFVLLVTAAATTNWVVLAVIHTTIVLFVLLLQIPIKDFAIRTWPLVLAFASLPVLPGTLNWVTPGEPLWVLYEGADWNLGGIQFPTALYVTEQGVKMLAFVTFRAAASLSLVVLLVKTTRWDAMTKAFGWLGLPTMVVMVFDMTYRYLFLFLLLLSDYILGRKSRVVAVETSKSKLLWVGHSLAGLFRIALEYGEEVTQAMLARGYSGEKVRKEAFQPVRYKDIIFLGSIVLFCVLVWGGPLWQQH